MKLFLLLLMLAPTAFASKKSESEAEVRRLTDEAQKLAGKTAWSGVERTYVQLLALERNGGQVSHDVHVLAAHAAQNRGDPLTTWERLKAANAVEMKMPTLSWIAEIEATYSRFEVTVAPGYPATFEVTSLDPLFDPAQQETVARFAKTLIEQRYAEALLPLGRYRIADDVVLESYGGETQKVTLRPRGSVVADPTVTQSTIPALPNTVLSVQVTGDASPDWSTKGPRLQQALSKVSGVAKATLVEPPPTWHFLSFTPSSLLAIETSPEALVGSLRSTFKLTDDQILIKETQIAVDSAAVPTLKDLATAQVTVGTVPVPIDAISRVRSGPRPGAIPAGVDVLLVEGTDRVAVTKALELAIASEDYNALQLMLAAVQ